MDAVCNFKRAALNAKTLILKTEILPFSSQKKRRKTLANNSNIKPALSIGIFENKDFNRK
jgi:hypothetical protein